MLNDILTEQQSLNKRGWGPKTNPLPWTYGSKRNEGPYYASVLWHSKRRGPSRAHDGDGGSGGGVNGDSGGGADGVLWTILVLISSVYKFIHFNTYCVWTTFNTYWFFEARNLALLVSCSCFGCCCNCYVWANVKFCRF